MTDIILSHLISLELPHNLLIADKGQSITIIPRKFTNDDSSFNSTWLDIAGLPVVHDEKLISQIKEKGVTVLEEKMNKDISLSNDDFESISKELIEKFSNQFIINY